MKNLLALTLTVTFSLAAAVSAMGADLCVGERVVDTESGGHFDAVIAEIYPDGTAYVKYDGNFDSRTVSLSALSPRISSFNGFAVGDRVVDTESGGHYDGKIGEIFPDGTAYVRYDGNFDSRTIPLTVLSHPINELNGFSVGDQVVDTESGGHYDGKIGEIFPDGTAYVRYDGNYDSRTVPLTVLSHRIYCEDTANCRQAR